MGQSLFTAKDAQKTQRTLLENTDYYNPEFLKILEIIRKTCENSSSRYAIFFNRSYGEQFHNKNFAEMLRSLGYEVIHTDISWVGCSERPKDDTTFWKVSW